jgi:hypothetical protein
MTDFINPAFINWASTLVISIAIALAASTLMTFWATRRFGLSSQAVLWTFIIGFALLGSVATAPMAEGSAWGARLYFYSLPFTFILIYFVPTIAAMSSKSSSFQAIFILNLFFGWSGIGWLVALAWAVSPPKKDPRPAYRITSFGAVPDEARVAVSRRPA